jgi:hypothetical protein
MKPANPSESIHLSGSILQTARRIAAIDEIDAATLIESLVLRHAEYIDLLRDAADFGQPFSLEAYTLMREAAETDDEFDARLAMFRSL